MPFASPPCKTSGDIIVVLYVHSLSREMGGTQQVHPLQEGDRYKISRPTQGESETEQTVTVLYYRKLLHRAKVSHCLIWKDYTKHTRIEERILNTLVFKQKLAYSGIQL